MQPASPTPGVVQALPAAARRRSGRAGWVARALVTGAPAAGGTPGVSYRLRRGPLARMPALADGEQALATDTADVYVGLSGANRRVGGSAHTADLMAFAAAMG